MIYKKKPQKAILQDQNKQYNTNKYFFFQINITT